MITNIIFRRSDSPITSDKPHYENEPFNIPKSWIMAQMSDLFLLNPKSEINDNTEIGFIPMACVDDGFSGKHSFEIRNWGDVKKGYCHFQDGDIGVAKISPCFENLKSCILQSLPNGVGTGTTELVILRSLGVYAPFYLYLFKSSWYISQGTKYFKGVVGQQRVNKAIFTELEVPLPSVAEQERIVAEIKRWFGLIDLIEKDKFNLANNIKLAKSKILDLAIHGKLVPQDPTDEPATELLKRINPKAEITCDNGHYQKLPEGWAILKVGNVAEYINGRAFKPEEWEQTGLPIIRIQNLNDPNAYYNRTKNEYEEKYLIKKGDLLFAWAASLGTYIWKGEDAWLNQHIFKVVPYPFMDKKYLYYAFHAMITEFYRKSHGSGMIHITRKQFEEITLWLPPLAEQYRIVQYLQQVFEKLDSIVENL